MVYTNGIGYSYTNTYYNNVLYNPELFNGSSLSYFYPRYQNNVQYNYQYNPAINGSIIYYNPYVQGNTYYQSQSYGVPQAPSPVYKEDTTKTKAENFNNWTDDVAMNPYQSAQMFQIKSDNTQKKKDYINDLEKLSLDYIKMYDTDKDGKISFDEFWNYELKNAEDKTDEFDADEKKALKKKLRTIYNHLNIINSNDSKDALTKDEIMNMFMTIDGTNASETADGFITKSEYMAASQYLADDSKGEDSDGNLYQKRLKQTYKRFFLQK